MSWTNYLLHDFWTARKFNEIDEARRVSDRARRRRSQESSRESRALQERIAELEQDLGEATLLLRTLADLCVEKGVLTAAEVADKAHALDAADGVVDGKISKLPPADPTA